MTAVQFTDEFYEDDFIFDPLPRYAAMRAAGAVVWLGHNKCFLVARCDQVVKVLHGHDRFQSGRVLSLNDKVAAWLLGSTLNTEGDPHSNRGSVTSVPFTPKNIEPLEDYMYTTGHSFTDGRVAMGQFDAVTDFATILALSIVVDLVCLNDEGVGEMPKKTLAACNLFEGFNARCRAAIDGVVGLQAYLSEQRCCDVMKERGLAQWIFDGAPNKGCSQAEAAPLMGDNINAALDTTVSVAGFAAYRFATDLAQWDILRTSPDLGLNAAEEIVRLTILILAFFQLVGEDTQVPDVGVKKCNWIIAVYASANRDDLIWGNPDRFDVKRNLRKDRGFGYGKNTCIGLHLARRELNNLIKAVLPQVYRWELDGTAEVAMNNTTRAFASLPVRVTHGSL